MDSANQVILVLQLLIYIGPLALYFVVLGLVNSQRQPLLVTSRTDFVTLAVVFLPALVSPVPFLVTHHWWWLLIMSATLTFGTFLTLLPAVDAGWVVYHTSESDMRSILSAATRRLGHAGDWNDNTLVLDGEQLRLRVSTFPWLGSVSIHVEGKAYPGRRRDVSRLRSELETLLERRSLLPSPVGTCLVLVGVLLAGIPLWMLFNHMDAIVNVVNDLLPA